MKIKQLFLCSMMLILCCPLLQAQKDNAKKRRFLPTGWYHVTDSVHGVEAKMYRTFETYYLDPTPIVTFDDFERILLDTIDQPRILLSLKADKIPVWAKATRESVGEKLAFVISNNVISAPTVQCEIQSGASMIGYPYSLEELKFFKQKLRKYLVTIPMAVTLEGEEACLGFTSFASVRYLDLTRKEGKEYLEILQKAKENNTPVRIYSGETKEAVCTGEGHCSASKAYLSKVEPASAEDIAEFNKQRSL